MTARIGVVGVVGLGLMGGSLLRRLAVVGLPATGWDLDPATGDLATAAGLSVSASMADLAAGCDPIFVAVPSTALNRVFAALPPDVVVSDLTSVKQRVRTLAAAHGLTFVGGHPMAGTEASGFAAASAELLAGAPWVLTLDDDTALSTWLTVAGILTSLGCRVVPCTSAVHDRAVARVSHLPHVLAAAVTSAAGHDPLALALAAGSFRDATRVAATRPELVAAMCGDNAEALKIEIAALRRHLEHLEERLPDPDRLTEFFAVAQRVRANWPPPAGPDTEMALDEDLRARLLALGSGGGCVTRVGPDRLIAMVPDTRGT